MRSGERELGIATVPYSASPEVAPVVAAIGRTEDIRFAPGGERLALPEYSGHRIHIFGLRHRDGPQGREIFIDRALTLRARKLREAHGVDFLGPHHLAVANRGGQVEIYRLPALAPGHAEIGLDPHVTLRDTRAAPIGMPGSLAAFPLGRRAWRIFVCNNDINTVTAHRVGALGLAAPRRIARRLVRNEGVVCAGPLEIPDGVAVDPDGRCIAVSNHATGEVLLFDATRRDRTPFAALGGMVCPHGLRFSPAGDWLHVADAGSPYLYNYERPRDGWTSMPLPTRCVRILDDETFTRGHVNPLEGGIKGLDIDPATGVLALACEAQPMAFCDLAAVLRLPRQDVEAEIAVRAEARDRALEKSRRYWAETRAAAAEQRETA